MHKGRLATIGSIDNVRNYYFSEFWMKVLGLRILSTTTRENLSTQPFIPTYKIIVSGDFRNKGFK